MSRREKNNVEIICEKNKKKGTANEQNHKHAYVAPKQMKSGHFFRRVYIIIWFFTYTFKFICAHIVFFLYEWHFYSFFYTSEIRNPISRNMMCTFLIK